ncbi:MAG: methyltransferase domain-containing protein [Candidatus Aminicenantes bacterium]
MNKKEFFDNIALDWEKEHRNTEEQNKLRILFSHLKLHPGDRVLDIGGGTGRLIPLIRKKIGGSGTIVEADFSWEMITIARRNHLRDGAHFLQSDAEQPSLAGNVFDAVICFAAFPHFSRKLKALKEFRRILKPGKILFIAHLMSRAELNQFHQKVKGPVTQDLLPTRAEMEKLLLDSGFKNPKIIDQPSLYIASASA